MFEHYFENIILKVHVVRNFTIFKMCERLFSDRKGKNSLLTNEEKLELAELVSKRKEEYDAEVARNVGKFKYDSKRKKNTFPSSQLVDSWLKLFVSFIQT